MSDSTYCPKYFLFALRKKLAAIIHKAKSDYKSKRLKPWGHFVTMLFSVLSGCSPIRETCTGLKAYQSKLNYANIKEVPARSILSDANKKRSAAVSGAIFSHLNSLYSNAIPDSTLPPKVLSRLFLIDSTVFSLFKAILKTLGRHSANGKKKDGIKKNTMLDGTTLITVQIRFNAATNNDQQFLQFIKLPEGSFLTFGKGL
ncbi:MAG: DUF4372 domain-containing protein [Aquabacterium sp.]|nr:DUF4372 domain-containing protein [Ferruginibacter sp.]